MFLTPARADCECGYAASIGNGSDRRVFTDLIETDFTRVADLNIDTSWDPQVFNLSMERARGPFGESFSVENVVPNPSRDGSGRAGPGANGRPPGLELAVKSSLVDSMVPVAEVASTRDDILWGSFRVGMRLTPTPGTCAAFFWYYNDTQEMDMEFLTKDFNAANGSFPVNLVLQSREALENGYDAQKTGNFRKVFLPFNPSNDFHEYRMDFLPGRVLFYADGKMLAELAGAAVPTHAGHLIISSWSNGNPLWSGGPPAQDSVTTISYVKAYFNSSTPTRQSDWANRCRDPDAPGAVCTIPDQKDAQTPYFFTAAANMTNNQTISPDQQSSSASGGSLVGRKVAGLAQHWLVMLLVALPFFLL